MKQSQQINYTQYLLYTDTEFPNCNYRAYIFYKEENLRKWTMRFTIVQDTAFSNVTNVFHLKRLFHRLYLLYR